MIRAGVRGAVAVGLLLAAAGCRAPGARVPEGITLVDDAPPPPPALVAEAQRQLQQLGWFAGTVDGELTPATRVALARLQRERELPITGRLDAATLEALGLPAVGPPAGMGGVEERESGASPAPVPAPPLEPPAAEIPPQPPPDVLHAAREEARRLLAGGIAAASPLPLPGELAAGPLAPEAARMHVSGAALERSRVQAFELLLRARADGGFALLPAVLIARLEEALAARSLLVHGADGRLGDDDEAAIRWVERSFGLEPTGVPGLRLLEALGIDPSPMFAP